MSLEPPGIKIDRTKSTIGDIIVIEDVSEYEQDETLSVQGLRVVPEGVFGIGEASLATKKGRQCIKEMIFVDDPLLLQKIKEKDAIIQELTSELKEARIFESNDLDLPDDYFEKNS